MNQKKKGYLISAIGCVVIILGIVAYYLFAGISKHDHTVYLYIDDDDNLDSVTVKLDTIATEQGRTAIRTLARHLHYADHIRSGKYAVTPSMSAFALFRNLRNGHQEPVRLTIPSVRTKERL